MMRKDASPERVEPINDRRNMYGTQYIPTKNEQIPIQADTLCTIGFSQTPPALPIRCRNDIAVYMMKKTTENASATARNAGVAAGGAAKTELGVLAVNTDVSVT